MTRRNKIIIVASIGSILAIGCLIAVTIYMAQQSTSQSNARQSVTKRTEAIENAKVNSENIGTFTDTYETDFYTARDTLIKTPVKDWNREVLDQAYFLIEYYQKTQSPDAVDDVLTQLSAAEAEGKNLDDNSLGRDAAYREKAKTWVTDTRKNVPGSSYYGSGEVSE